MTLAGCSGTAAIAAACRSLHAVSSVTLWHLVLHTVGFLAGFLQLLQLIVHEWPNDGQCIAALLVLIPSYKPL